MLIVDIDECATDNGNCEHVCANSIGSFGCGCYAGYQLSSDGRNCTGTKSSSVCMYIMIHVPALLQLPTNVTGIHV